MVVPGGTTPFMTNRLRPSGGVEKPTSNATSVMIANHTGSKPSDCASGKKKGTVIIMMEMASINVPSASNTKNMHSSISSGDSSKLIAHWIKPLEAPENANN